MKKLIYLVLILLLTVPALYARGNRGLGRHRAKSMVPYKQESVRTISGTVLSSEISFNRHMKQKGLHLKVKTAEGTYTVHVCPEWYAQKRNLSFEKGNSISVKGSVFMLHGEKNIYAATIRYGEEVLKLRDPDSGKHLWRGRYRSQ